MSVLSRFSIWVLALCFASTILAQDEELLEPDKAFALSAIALDANTIEVSWDIADNYYMYRDKFKFDVTDGAQLSKVNYSMGKTKHDELFGDVEVYLNQARFTMELAKTSGSVNLQLTGQGCNEPIGVCYPPIIKQLTLALPISDALAADDPVAEVTNILQPALKPLSTPTQSSSAVLELKSLLGDLTSSDEFLSVDQAFQVNMANTGDNQLEAQFNIAEGYYLYKDKIDFTIDQGDARIGQFSLPPGKAKIDEYYGEMTVFVEDFPAQINLLRSKPEATSILVTAAYQGCADKGICYPPEKKQFTINLPELIASAEASQSTVDEPSNGVAEAAEKSLFGYLIAAFGVGLLLTFTPCVLPLIPILSSIVVGQGEKASRSKGGMLSIIYVMGTAVTYAAIGWVAGATGEQLQAYFQNIWSIGTISIIFVLMSLSMFGLYRIQIPSFIQSRIQEKSGSMQGGTIGMVFVLGLMSALIVGACVSPLLISLLSVAISKGSPLLGASMMFSMALGMGVFLIAIGLGAGFLLPKAGIWMDRVNYAFGVMLLAVAIYLLSAIPAVPVLLLWAVLLTITAVFMGATQPLPEGASGWRYLNKGIGTVLLVWGVLALLGGLNGNRDIMNPLPLNQMSFASGSSTAPQSTHVPFIQVTNLEELDVELAKASNSGKHLMLDFYADWCTDCIRMEKSTFIDPEVAARFDQDFILAQVDVTDPDHQGGKDIKKRYSVFGPPAMLFFRNGENEIRDLRLYGYRNVSDFTAVLNKI